MVKLLALFFFLALHPVHVSFLSIDGSPDGNQLNVFLRVYFDDFLLDSGAGNADQKSLNFTVSNQATNKVLSDYVHNRINITVNDKLIKGELINTELSDNELRMHLVYRDVANIKTIKVKNLIMTSLNPDQANMTVVRVADFEEGVKLTSLETEKTFRIN